MPSKELLDYLPVWKRGATASERLYELAQIAAKHPEYFDKWVIVYCEDNEQCLKVRTISGTGTRTIDSLGVLTAGIQEIWERAGR